MKSEGTYKPSFVPFILYILQKRYIFNKNVFFIVISERCFYIKIDRMVDTQLRNGDIKSIHFCTLILIFLLCPLKKEVKRSINGKNEGTKLCFFNTIHKITHLTFYFSILGLHKTYFIIEQQLPRQIMKYTKYLSYPFSFYATQIICPFLNSSISANHDKVDGLSANR